jgi:hypothetical protein
MYCMYVLYGGKNCFFIHNMEGHRARVQRVQYLTRKYLLEVCGCDRGGIIVLHRNIINYIAEVVCIVNLHSGFMKMLFTVGSHGFMRWHRKKC